MGEESSEDLKLLSTRIRHRNDPSIPKDAVYIFATNIQVNKMNKVCLEQLETEEFVVKAKVSHKTMKNYKPLVDNDGNIHGTGLQNELKLKIGAKVLLTNNLRTSDGLTNGAFGEILGYEFKLDDSLKALL